MLRRSRYAVVRAISPADLVNAKHFFIGRTIAGKSEYMMTFAVFALVFLSVLVGAHFFVFSSLAFFFASFGILSRVSVLILSVVFPVNFLLASFFAHSVDNVVSRAWYALSAFSLGLVSNLFFLVLFGWGMILLLRLSGLRLETAVLGMLILAFGTAVSLYGISNAYRPIVKRVSVTIPNLPAQWKGKTIVQLSDIHLGPIYRTHFLRGVVSQVNSLHPDVVVITGDLFDGMDGSIDALASPLGDIRSERGIFFVTGNHETYLGVTRALSALEGTGVEILDDRLVVVDGLAIIGISYPERGAEKDVPALAAELSGSVSGTPNILLYHAPTDIDRMKDSGINLQLSGHTHRGQQFPFNFATHLVHKGYDYGSYDFGGYTLHASSGVGTWGPPIRIGTRSEIVAITLE
jgi:predicted MPP superfamily phosphohydrolase